MHALQARPDHSFMVALASLVLVGGVGAAAHATVVSFSCFPATPSQAVPPAVGTHAVGYGTATLDTATNLFTWDMEWEKVAPFSPQYHFHTGAPGTVGAIVLTLSETSADGGSALLTPAQAADVLAGNWYFDIHDSLYHDGEIRAQVIATGCELTVYGFSPLSGSQVVPPNTEPASGTATFVVNAETHTLYRNVSWSGLSGPATAAHIHVGAPGTNGFIHANLKLTSDDPTGFSSGSLTDTDIADLNAGLWYVDIHTALHPEGELRGQLVNTGVPQWEDLGHGLAGTHGVPVLFGFGPMTGGSSNGMTLLNGHGFNASTLFIGAAEIDVPLKGGVLVPSVDIVVNNIFVTATGSAALPFTWPGDAVLVGFQLYWQQWMPDPAGVKGVSATNALRSTGQ